MIWLLRTIYVLRREYSPAKGKCHYIHKTEATPLKSNLIIMSLFFVENKSAHGIIKIRLSLPVVRNKPLFPII